MPASGRPVFAPILRRVFPPMAHAEILDHIVAAVNNEVITESELAEAVALNVRFGKPGMDPQKPGIRNA